MLLSLKVNATSRFQESLKDCADKPMVFREIRELIIELERKSGQHSGTARNIKPLRGVIRDIGKTQGLSIQEWKLTKRGRLIFDYSGELNLIDFAPNDTHTSVESLNRLSREECGAVLGSLTPVSDAFLDLLVSKEYDSLVPEELNGGDREKYVEERFDEWIRYLDRPQIQVRDEILLQVSKPGFSVHLLIGGPGTGKTMVLIDLAVQYGLMSGQAPELQLPPSVRHYVESSNLPIPGLRKYGGDLMIVDDPPTYEALERSVENAKSANVPIVIGIDPTQWHGRRTIEKFYKFVASPLIKRYELQLCYRQGGVIGNKAISLIQGFLDKSSAFAKEERILAERTMAADWETICLKDLSFSDNSGYFNLYPFEVDIDSKVYLDLKHSAYFESKRNWPKVLIAYESKETFPPAIRASIEQAKSDFPQLSIREREYKKVGDVRGAEFETVLMFLSEKQIETLNKGIEGASTPDWEAATSILTFLTRAQNRLSIFTV